MGEWFPWEDCRCGYCPAQTCPLGQALGVIACPVKESHIQTSLQLWAWQFCLSHQEKVKFSRSAERHFWILLSHTEVVEGNLWSCFCRQKQEVGFSQASTLLCQEHSHVKLVMLVWTQSTVQRMLVWRWTPCQVWFSSIHSLKLVGTTEHWIKQRNGIAIVLSNFAYERLLLRHP